MPLSCDCIGFHLLSVGCGGYTEGMNQSALYNLSGRAISENARITISGDCKPGDVLVIDEFDGTQGTAHWWTMAKLESSRAEREKAKPKSAAQTSSWPPQLKPRAPYS